ncbi:MAG TPA: M23 family metallopeptidase [Flavobacteriales bacterium]|nr:M23 family metallopeptidase [Flavobacteriales bacterium]
MSEIKYIYNKSTLSYERLEQRFLDKLKRVFSYVIVGGLFAAIFIALTYTVFDSPKEKVLKRENSELTLQYEILNNRSDQIAKVLVDLQERDDNIYRVIFEAEPIPNEIREAGFGGINRYKDLQGFKHSALMTETTKILDKLSKQLYIQSKSLDYVFDMAKNKSEMLAAIPAIQPISNQNLTRVASGFGSRIHPIYKTKKLHTGMDFTAPKGTEIYTTGNGVISEAKYSKRGYGNHVVIDHGYGYHTLYAHMKNLIVRIGQKVKRGEVIGFVGNSGSSVGPHLHYEVIKKGVKINPINFYYNDLSPEEYEKMIEISSRANQSFD